MRVLIISDSHGYDENFFKILEETGEPDFLIHCGDSHGHEDVYRRAVNCRFMIVAGNNDFYLGSKVRDEEEFDIGPHHVFLTHGHRYKVYYDNQKIVDAAKARGADIVMFGHTHRPVVTLQKGILMVNPGSLTYPRQEGRRPSYIVMKLEDDDPDASFEIKYL